jgi:hypothetical protein
MFKLLSFIYKDLSSAHERKARQQWPDCIRTIPPCAVLNHGNLQLSLQMHQTHFHETYGMRSNATGTSLAARDEACRRIVEGMRFNDTPRHPNNPRTRWHTLILCIAQPANSSAKFKLDTLNFDHCHDVRSEGYVDTEGDGEQLRGHLRIIANMVDGRPTVHVGSTVSKHELWFAENNAIRCAVNPSWDLHTAKRAQLLPAKAFSFHYTSALHGVALRKTDGAMQDPLTGDTYE